MDLEQHLRIHPLKIRDVWTEQKTARLPREVLRRGRRRTLTRAAMASSCAAGLLAVLAWRGALHSPFQSNTEPDAVARAAAAAAERVVTFSDGSRAQLSEMPSRVEIKSDRADQVSLSLLEGGARFDVVRNAKRMFEVQAGPVRVQVIGTSFSMLRGAEGTRVAVERGRVRVLWDGQQTELAAGESGVFPKPEKAPEVAAPAPTAAASADAADTGPNWRDLARRGDYSRAYTALRRDKTPLRQVPEELMLAADVARLSGNPAQAVPHLQTVVRRFASDARAPIAAFTLGRIYLDNLGKPAEAAASFRRARTSWPSGPLALDAWAREVDALRRAGQATEAAVQARKYLERYPNGQHAASMRRALKEH